MAGIKKIFVTGITSKLKSTEQTDTLGDIRLENGKFYKYVNFNQATMTATAGDCVAYIGSTGYVSNVVTVDYSEAGVKRIGAGIVGVAISTSEDRYIWIQIKGLATVATALGGSATDGSELVLEGAANAAMDMLVKSTGATQETVFAIAEDATAKTIICDFPF